MPITPFATATVPVTFAALPLVLTLMVAGSESVTPPVDALGLVAQIGALWHQDGRRAAVPFVVGIQAEMRPAHARSAVGPLVELAHAPVACEGDRFPTGPIHDGHLATRVANQPGLLRPATGQAPERAAWKAPILCRACMREGERVT